MELSLTEISYVLYVQALMYARRHGSNDAKIVRSRDAQCNTKELP